MKGVIFESHCKQHGKWEKSTNLSKFKDFMTLNFFKILGFDIFFVLLCELCCEQRFDVSLGKGL